MMNEVIYCMRIQIIYVFVYIYVSPALLFLYSHSMKKSQRLTRVHPNGHVDWKETQQRGSDACKKLDNTRGEMKGVSVYSL
jgi:hypothetical protein